MVKIVKILDNILSGVLKVQNFKEYYKEQRMSNEQKQGNVKVVCRFRPLNERQKAMGAVIVQQLYDDKTVGIKQNKEGKSEALKFSFDKVFDCNSTQEQVYNYAASSVVESVIEGFNGTIFAYGQTSSGKTHTMEGQIDNVITKQSGIVPRMVQQVFDCIQSSSQNIQFRIKVSLVELYLQKLRDLIDPKKNDLKIRSDKKRGIYIEDLSETYISCPQEVYSLIKIARDSRAIAATNMNQRSSRSHMLFILTVSQNNTDDLSGKTGKLYLVDLAGSEKVGKTGAEGKVLDEAKKINVSLTALGKVINALTDGKSTHVPYRDSKLTRVLQESLGGNSKTSLIVTCSPHLSNTPQTISTLRFGISAKKIKNKPKINKEMTIAELQSLLEKAQRQMVERDKYIQQLKNYITSDLKQKVPNFTINQKNTFNVQDQQTELVTQLERQLEMERNLHTVQEEQLTSLKNKCDQLLIEKEELEKQNQQLNNKQRSLIKTQITTIQMSGGQYQHNVLEELQKLTDDQAILQLFRSSSVAPSNPNPITEPNNYQELQQQYEIERQRRKKAEDTYNKYEKNMQKKLMQLENNITQLTHAYYDLVVVQQRWKVDNLFLKRNVEEKELSIHSLKERIKDLEDQNRDLEQQKWNIDEDGFGKRRMPIIQEEKEQRDPIDYRTNQQHLAKVVKILKGGHK